MIYYKSRGIEPNRPKMWYLMISDGRSASPRSTPGLGSTQQFMTSICQADTRLGALHWHPYPLNHIALLGSIEWYGKPWLLMNLEPFDPTLRLLLTA